MIFYVLCNFSYCLHHSFLTGLLGLISGCCGSPPPSPSLSTASLKIRDSLCESQPRAGGRGAVARTGWVRAYLDTMGGSKSSCHNNNWTRDMIRAVTSLYSEFRMFPYPLSRHVTLMDCGEFLSSVPRFLVSRLTREPLLVVVKMP